MDTEEDDTPVASLTNPPIPGLYFDPAVRISDELERLVMDFCHKTYFTAPGANQVMLFGRAPQCSDPEGDSDSGLPPLLKTLLDAVSLSLKPSLSKATFDLLFPSTPTQARQAIINLYYPGEGITPHVDLLGRYADGIMGVSLGSGCTMRFDEASGNDSGQRYDLYLPERSVVVLSEEARYQWTHGIDKRQRDLVAGEDGEGRWVDRGVRISVTFRWMLEGADVLAWFGTEIISFLFQVR